MMTTTAPRRESSVEKTEDVLHRKGNLSVGGELRYTFDEGNIRRFEQLLEQGADPNARVASDPFLLLTYVTDQGSGEAVEMLLRHGADVDAEDGAGRRALFYACRAARRDLVQQLLRAGAEAQGALNPLGMNGAHVAAHIGAAGVLEDLLSLSARRGMVHARTAAGETPLHIAVARQKKACVAVLLDAGSHINARTSMGHTPLHLAAMNGSSEIGSMLLAVGTDMWARGGGAETRRSAIKLARDFGHQGFVRMILDKSKRNAVRRGLQSGAGR